MFGNIQHTSSKAVHVSMYVTRNSDGVCMSMLRSPKVFSLPPFLAKRRQSIQEKRTPCTNCSRQRHHNTYVQSTLLPIAHANIDDSEHCPCHRDVCWKQQSLAQNTTTHGVWSVLPPIRISCGAILGTGIRVLHIHDFAFLGRRRALPHFPFALQSRQRRPILQVLPLPLGVMPHPHLLLSAPVSHRRHRSPRW